MEVLIVIVILSIFCVSGIGILVKYEGLSNESVRASKFYSARRMAEDLVRNQRDSDTDKMNAINRLFEETGLKADGFEILDVSEVDVDVDNSLVKYFKIIIRDNMTGRTDEFYVAQFSV